MLIVVSLLTIKHAWPMEVPFFLLTCVLYIGAQFIGGPDAAAPVHVWFSIARSAKPTPQFAALALQFRRRRRSIYAAVVICFAVRRTDESFVKY